MQNTMPNKQPALFISHGSPMLAIEESETARFLTELGKSLEKPEAIVVFSAHLDVNDEVVITAGKQPGLIYDFYGFPPPLYQLEYPAPGHPELAKEIAETVQNDGINVRLDEQLGWDHGVWMPLYLMFPAADIPVVQVSVSSRLGAGINHRLGELLAPLRNKGILMIGSGGISHNLRELFSAHPDPEGKQKVTAFTDWVADRLQQGDKASLVNYNQKAPYARFNHPTDEHFLPLLCVLGNSETQQVTRLHQAVTYEILALDAYRFD